MWFRITPNLPGMKQNWQDPPPSECPSGFKREWSDNPSVDLKKDSFTAINFLLRVKPTPGCFCPAVELKFHFFVQMGNVSLIDPTRYQYTTEPVLKPGWHVGLEAAGCGMKELAKLVSEEF